MKSRETKLGAGMVNRGKKEKGKVKRKLFQERGKHNWMQEMGQERSERGQAVPLSCCLQAKTERDLRTRVSAPWTRVGPEDLDSLLREEVGRDLGL